MGTNELTDLMRDVWQDADLFPKLERFLTLCRGPYQNGRNLEDEIDWSTLETAHSWEEFGNCCSQMDGALERLEQGEGPAEAAASGSGIQFFRDEETFRNFCHRSLKRLQKNVQRRLVENAAILPSRKDRKDEYERESQEDIKNIYNATKTLREEAKQYALAAEDHSKAADQCMKAADQLKRRTAQLKIDAINAQHAAESIIPNMLTTLGVFIAIVVAVVGCYLSLIFNRHQNPGFPVLNFSMCLLMGHILLNVIFLLMYLISKLTNYTMACHCRISRQMDCSRCPHEIQSICNLSNRVWLRYPYVVLLNGIFLLGYAALGLWHFLRSYLGEQIDWQLNREPLLVMALAVGMAALFTLIARKVLHSMVLDKGLRDAAEKQSKDMGFTEKEEGLNRRVLELVDRVERLEALYEGSKGDNKRAENPRL